MAEETQQQSQGQSVEMVQFGGESISNLEKANNILKEFRGSAIIEDMLTADAYYNVKNTEIQEKTRSYKSYEGQTIENENASNAKIPSAFIRLSVDQKANYAFGKPFTLEVFSTSDDEKDVSEDQETYENEWRKFLNDENRDVIYLTAIEAINKGRGAVYVGINGNEELELVDTVAETLYPAWEDRAHKKLTAVVRDYTVVEYKDGEPEIIKKVEYWDTEVVEQYIDEDGELTVDNDGDKSHFNGRTGGWGKVPFIILKASQNETPLLNFVKNIVDEYDYLNSKTVDSLKDDIDAVLVLSGVTAAMGELTKTREIIKSSRIATIKDKGSAFYLQNNPNISAILEKQENMYKQIMQWSSTVDTNDVKVGTNNSGVALKAMYQNLDLYCNGLERHFRFFMKSLKYFFDKYLELKGIMSAEKSAFFDIRVTLDRDMMIDMESLIKQTVLLKGTNVSQKTIDTFNPAVADVEEENQRRQEEMEQEAGYDDSFRKLVTKEEEEDVDEEK